MAALIGVAMFVWFGVAFLRRLPQILPVILVIYLITLIWSWAAHSEILTSPRDAAGNTVTYTNPQGLSAEDRLKQLEKNSTARCASGQVLEQRLTGPVCVTYTDPQHKKK